MSHRIGLGLWMTLALLLGACGSDSDGGDADPIEIVAPADGAALNRSPIDIVVRVGAGADPAALRVLLGGVDISDRFQRADADGMRRAQVDRPAVNLGRNQLRASIGSRQVHSSFLFALGDGDPVAAALPLLVPVATRVVSNDGSQAGDYAVALYTDPAMCLRP